MNNKRKITILILSVILLMVLGLCLLSAFGLFKVYNDEIPNLSLFRMDHIKGIVSNTYEYHVENNDDFIMSVNLDYGSIRIHPADGNFISIEETRIAWADSEEKALQEAKNLPVIYDAQNDRLSISFTQDSYAVNIFGTNIEDRIDLDIYLPQINNISLQTKNGEILLANLESNIEIFSSHGDIELDHISGKIELNNKYGDISASNITAENLNIKIISQFGDVNLEQITTKGAFISINQGNLFVDTLQITEEFQFESQYGDVVIKDIKSRSSSMDINNGDIEFINGTIEEEFTAISNFGNITIEELLAGKYDLQTGNGGIELKNISGSIEARTTYGDIELINISSGILNLTADNGNIRFSGSLNQDHDQTFSSKYGNIDLEIPEDSSFLLQMESVYGEISSEFDLDLLHHFEDSTKERIQCNLNNGGSILDIFADNGNIYLQILGNH